MKTFGLKREDFLAIVDGMEMDVPQDIRAPDMATLDLYCDRVASAVGRLSVRVFGLPEEDGIELAHHLGRALQLTNILRDIDEDAGLGRLYLPREALLHAGITSNDPRPRDRRARAAEGLPAAGAAAQGVFREVGRDHEPQQAPRGARAADHVEILSAFWNLLIARGLQRAARAGACVEGHTHPDPAPLRSHLMQKTAHIIGAGISGLSAAVRLANAGFKVAVHEATQQAGGRCRSYFDGATNLTIDNGNHLLLSGNSHARAYARSIGTEAGLVGPERAQFPFVDLTTGQRWQIDLGDGRLPTWVLDESRRVPDTGLTDYLKLAPLIWASERRWSASPFPAKASSISAWCSRCCLRRSTSIRPRARPGLPARSCARRCLPADRPAVP